MTNLSSIEKSFKQIDTFEESLSERKQNSTDKTEHLLRQEEIKFRPYGKLSLSGRDSIVNIPQDVPLSNVLNYVNTAEEQKKQQQHTEHKPFWSQSINKSAFIPSKSTGNLLISKLPDEATPLRLLLREPNHSASSPMLPISKKIIFSDDGEHVAVEKIQIQASTPKSPKPKKKSKIINHLISIDSKAREQINQDVSRRTNDIREEVSGMFSNNNNTSTHLPIASDGQQQKNVTNKNIVLTTERLRSNSDLQHKLLLAEQENEAKLKIRDDALRKYEHAKLTSTQFYNFCIKLTGSRAFEDSTFDLYIGHGHSDPSILYSNLRINEDGLLVFEEPHGTVFEGCRYFSWISEPRDLLDLHFRVTMFMSQQNFMKPKRKIVDCIFAYDAYERISLISNINTSENVTKAVSKRTSTRKFDEMNTLKKNLSAYRKRDPKAKVKIVETLISNMEQLVIMFTVRLPRSESRSDNQRESQSPSPKNHDASKFNHTYYEFGVSRFGSKPNSRPTTTNTQASRLRLTSSEESRNITIQVSDITTGETVEQPVRPTHSRLGNAILVTKYDLQIATRQKPVLTNFAIDDTIFAKKPKLDFLTKTLKIQDPDTGSINIESKHIDLQPQYAIITKKPEVIIPHLPIEQSITKRKLSVQLAPIPTTKESPLSKPVEWQLNSISSSTRKQGI
jgi:hypothetical protein